MWKIQEAHRWIDKPYHHYEIRREMRVRESRHTVMLYDRKYYDCDTGKYDTNKLHTIATYCVADLVRDYGCDEPGINGYKQRYAREEQDYQKWFIPKDDEFDIEEETEILEKEKLQKALREKKEREERVLKEWKEREERDYQLKLKEAEYRVNITRGLNSINKHHGILYNVMMNKWSPK